MRAAIDIACCLLAKVAEGGTSQSQITPLKLQKLLYYAQAWSLVFRKKLLFSEEIEAWVHGPVVPSVYRRFKHYGFNNIANPSVKIELEEDTVRILDLVLNSYGTKSGKFLEYLSHSEYPWIQARKGLQSNHLSQRRISLQDMMNYYMQFKESEQPPKISSLALRVRRNPRKNNCATNVLFGMTSVLDIFPESSVKSVYVVEDFSSVLSDSESMSSDWEKIGGDIQTVFSLVEEEFEASHE